MVKFVIIRHGHSTGNKDCIFCGQLDVDLNETGFQQADETGKYVAENYKIDAIYSSDLIRTVNTIKPLAERLSIPINTDKRLREVDVGEWQGVPIADVERDFPEELAFYRSNPGDFVFKGGEGYRDMLVRVVDFFEETAKANDGKTIAVSTHGGCIRTLIAHVKGIPLNSMENIPFVPNASVSVLTYDNGKWEFELMSYADHLEVKSGKFLVV